MRTIAVAALLLALPLAAEKPTWERLAPAGAEFHNPRWSSDGSAVFVEQYSEEAGVEIQALSGVGNDSKLLCSLSEGVACLDVFPDGRRVLVRTTEDRLATLDIENGRTEAISVPPARLGFGAVSPDANSMAWMSGNLGSATLCVARLDGTQTKELAQLKLPTGAVSWSPDGKRLLYVTVPDDEPATGRLHVVSVDDGGETTILLGEIVPNDAAWSPDGHWLAFVGSKGRDRQLYLARPDGADPHPFVIEDAKPVCLAWSPDSRSILAIVTLRSGVWAARRYAVP